MEFRPGYSRYFNRKRLTNNHRVVLFDCDVILGWSLSVYAMTYYWPGLKTNVTDMSNRRGNLWCVRVAQQSNRLAGTEQEVLMVYGDREKKNSVLPTGRTGAGRNGIYYLLFCVRRGYNVRGTRTSLE